MGGALMTVDIGYGRGWLEVEAAKSQARIDKALGHPQQITEAGRDYAVQDAHYQRYVAYLNGGPWAPIALAPWTPSVHQKGRAKDTDERDVALMNDHGWFQTVYRIVNGKRTLVEPWHFEYDPARDNHRHEPAPSGGASISVPKSEEDDMLFLIVNYKNGSHRVSLSNKTFRHFIQGDPYKQIAKDAGAEWKNIQAGDLDAYLRTFGCDLGIYRSPTGSTFLVFDPLKNEWGSGNVWTAENAIRAEHAKKK